MARYIDEEKLIVNLMDYSKGKKTIGQCVTDTPTEDVAPVIHGRWLKNKNRMAGEGLFICSNCKNDTYNTTNYCCYCGTKMEGAKYGEH